MGTEGGNEQRGCLAELERENSSWCIGSKWAILLRSKGCTSSEREKGREGRKETSHEE